MSVKDVFDKVLDDDIMTLNNASHNDKEKIFLIAIIYDKPKVALEAFNQLNYQLNDYTDKSNQHTVIMQAISYKALNVAQAFINLGCDASIKNKDGLSAYKIACLMQNIEAVKLLEKCHVPYDNDILRVAFIYAKDATLAIHLLNNGANYDTFIDLLKDKMALNNFLDGLDVKNGEYFFELIEKNYEKDQLDNQMNNYPLTNTKSKIKI